MLDRQDNRNRGIDHAEHLLTLQAFTGRHNFRVSGAEPIPISYPKHPASESRPSLAMVAGPFEMGIQVQTRGRKPRELIGAVGRLPFVASLRSNPYASSVSRIMRSTLKRLAMKAGPSTAAAFRHS